VRTGFVGDVAEDDLHVHGRQAPHASVGVGVATGSDSEQAGWAKSFASALVDESGKRWRDAVTAFQSACCCRKTIAPEGIDLARAEEFAAGHQAWAITLV